MKTKNSLISWLCSEQISRHVFTPAKVSNLIHATSRVSRVPCLIPLPTEPSIDRDRVASMHYQSRELLNWQLCTPTTILQSTALSSLKHKAIKHAYTQSYNSEIDLYVQYYVGAFGQIVYCWCMRGDWCYSRCLVDNRLNSLLSVSPIVLWRLIWLSPCGWMDSYTIEKCCHSLVVLYSG